MGRKGAKVEKASRWQGKRDEKKQKVRVHKVRVHKDQGKIRQMCYLQLMLPAPMIEFGQMELGIDFDLQPEHWSYQMPRIYI